MQTKFPLLNFFVAFLALTTLSSPIAFGQEGNRDKDIEREMKDLVKELVKLGPGVHEITSNEDGRVVSFFVVGQARISTALGKAKGLEIARRNAELDCSAQVVKWVKQAPLIYESSDNEEVIVIEKEGSETPSSRKELGKAIEKSSKKMEAVSSGVVRGLQLINSTKDGETYSVIKHWSIETSESTKGILKGLSSDEESIVPEKQVNASSEERPSDEIESESTTSRALYDILKRRKK